MENTNGIQTPQILCRASRGKKEAPSFKRQAPSGPARPAERQAPSCKYQAPSLKLQASSSKRIKKIPAIFKPQA